MSRTMKTYKSYFDNMCATSTTTSTSTSTKLIRTTTCVNESWQNVFYLLLLLLFRHFFYGLTYTHTILDGLDLLNLIEKKNHLSFSRQEVDVVADVVFCNSLQCCCCCCNRFDVFIAVVVLFMDSLSQ